TWLIMFLSKIFASFQNYQFALGDGKKWVENTAGFLFILTWKVHLPCVNFGGWGWLPLSQDP
ncbi:MAG: hypothetical protein ACK56I_05930, partial [bacterium]